jgi:hypothetical protein
MQDNTATLGESLAVAYKTKHTPTYDPTQHSLVNELKTAYMSIATL